MSELVRSHKLEVESIGGLNAGSYEVSVSGYGTSPYLWFYSEKGNRFKRISAKKVKRGDSRKFVSVPTHYKGKRLTKYETLFLLNVHRRWREYATGSLERIESLISMHRSSVKSSRSDALKGTFLWGGVWSAIPTASYPLALGNFDHFDISNFMTIGGASFAVFTSIIAVLQASRFFPDRLNMSTTSLHDAFIFSDDEFVHEDFREFHEFLKKEWMSYTHSDEVSTKSLSPSPLRVEEYREKYRILKTLERGDSLYSIPGFSLEGSTVPNTTSSVDEPSWVSLHEIVNAVKKEWAEWELDILRIVQYPALFDMREATTVDFHRALITVESMTLKPDEVYSANHPFVSAVNNLKLAWTVAKNEAERIQQSNFDEEERGRLSKAMDLLRIALNVSGTPSERQTSYKRAMKQLEGIVRVPMATMNEIESGIGLKELEGA